MSFTIESSKGEIFDINVWNWHTISKLLYKKDFIDSQTLELLSFNGSGVEFSEAEALEIAVFLENHLKSLPPNTERILFDLSPSETKDDGTLYREPEESDKNYSASVQVLEGFKNFCRDSGGFKFY